MKVILYVFSIQGLLGAFDTIYHHEYTERLPQKQSAKKELLIHGIRNFMYFIIFITLGWAEICGLYAWVFILILAIEVLLTLWDFVIEDKTRKLPASERITHTILTLNYGAILSMLVPELVKWGSFSTNVKIVSYGYWSWVMTFYAVGVLIWSFRDLYSSKYIWPNAMTVTNRY